MIKILTELKMFTRGTAPAEGFSIADVIDRVLHLVATETRTRCRIVRAEAADVAPVAGDDQRLAQVVLNLIINAVQAFAAADPERNTITIATSMIGRDVAIEISDNGPGIVREHLPRVFEPFFTTRPGVGTGLGLTVCRTLVHAMGGTLTVDSEPGRGTTFAIRLRVFDGTVPRRAPRTSELAIRAQA